MLRRGIIEGCEYLRRLPKEKQCFKDFIKENEKKPDEDGLMDYLDVLANFLSLHKANNKEALYKLFIRTLAHEWEAAEPQRLNGQSELYAFSWIMKMTRNWSAHSSVFECLTEQDVAYLFIVNMRVMFELGDEILPYERRLLALFDKPLSADVFRKKVGDNFNSRSLPLVENYAMLLKKTGNTWQAINFHDALNNLQKKSSADNNRFLIQGLYQTFWFLTSNGRVYIPQDEEKIKSFSKLNYQFQYFDYRKPGYIFEFARHIYESSFFPET